ncbi:MAG: alkaline phosphatase family protein [SAR324 cluster bacterium]|nr:alkaline phosphatase family protein [SAR324 cluster bacterium]
MPEKLLMGPLLGIEDDSRYTVCFLATKKSSPEQWHVEAGSRIQHANPVTSTPQGLFFRTEIMLEPQTDGRWETYRILEQNEPVADRFGRSQWRFYIPGIKETPRMAYASCNGFSSASLVKKTTNPWELWHQLRKLHQEHPLSLLMMGGDQVYADELWSRIPALENWSRQAMSQQIARKPPARMILELRRFYEQLYISAWSADEAMSEMLASIPSVMMWDDHDIFDGWGSYPAPLQQCPVFKQIFSVARDHFILFQLRSLHNKTMLHNIGDGLSWGLRFRDFLILGLDLRTQRTRKQVMNLQHWQEVKSWLNQQTPAQHFLVLSSVPVVYRSFALIEKYFEATPWLEELEDDVFDHWSATPHQGERMKLIHNLLRYSRHLNSRHTVILSGDVHVGGLGQIKDQETGQEIIQIISSGIVHPPPSLLQWNGLLAVTKEPENDTEYQAVTTRLLTPFGAQGIIRSRNFMEISLGSDDKLWCRWHCEKPIDAVYPVAPQRHSKQTEEVS